MNNKRTLALMLCLLLIFTVAAPYAAFADEAASEDQTLEAVNATETATAAPTEKPKTTARAEVPESEGETAEEPPLEAETPEPSATVAPTSDPTGSPMALVYPDTTYSAKQGETITIWLPIVYKLNGAEYYSNRSSATDGVLIDTYSVMDSSYFDQALATEINQMFLTLKTKSMPFTAASMTEANGSDARYVVKGGINQGWAVFDLTVKSGAAVKTHKVPFTLYWTDANGGTGQTDVSVKVKVTKKSSSSSGSSGGGSGTPTNKALPVARLIIDNVHTEPKNPKAGDAFDIVITLVNTSKTLYLQNLLLSYSVADDALLPAGEATNYIYIKKINADARYEQRIPVVSQPELSSKLVKVDVAVEFEDKKMAALSASQTLTIAVQPVQRIKVDELKLPTGSVVALDNYDISVNVANTGKTKLYNLSASVVSDDPNLSTAGSTFYGGDLDPAASKTLELSCTPIEEGSYSGRVEITYEDELGVAVPPVIKEFSFTANPEETYDYGFEETDPYAPVEPVPQSVSALSIMGMLPWQLYVALAVLLLLVIVSMTVSAARRRRRAFEDDEMD